MLFDKLKVSVSEGLSAAALYACPTSRCTAHACPRRSGDIPRRPAASKSSRITRVHSYRRLGRSARRQLDVDARERQRCARKDAIPRSGISPRASWCLIRTARPHAARVSSADVPYAPLQRYDGARAEMMTVRALFRAQSSFIRSCIRLGDQTRSCSVSSCRAPAPFYRPTLAAPRRARVTRHQTRFHPHSPDAYATGLTTPAS